MIFGSNQQWRPPLFMIGRIPIHAAGLVVLLQIVGMLVVVVAGSQAFMQQVYFHPEFFLAGKIWTPVSYAFFEPPGIMFVIGLYFFFHFGSAVENGLGRQRFLSLCLILLFLPPAILLGCHFLALRSSPLAGSYIPHLSVFMAFCAMHPNVPSFFGVRIKWFGLVFLAIGTLQLVGAREWPMVLALLATVAAAVSYVRKAGYTERFGLDEELLGPGRRIQVPKPKPRRKAGRKPRRKPESKLRPRSKVARKRDSEVDRILDKINEEGLHSLTDDERKLLKDAAGEK
ncbi:MAG: hypothetical protein HKO57_14565 [Akkermansiaceae bacterium]|nr:hypothetical protein [Akkermansiaceae bacterium]